MVEGVTKGYEKRLKIEGIGYQARMDKKAVVLTVGYANAIEMTPPEGVTVELPDPTTIVIKGADKQKVGQFAAEVRRVRKPEPYKGKGIRYENEQVRRKEGKSFASGGVIAECVSLRSAGLDGHRESRSGSSGHGSSKDQTSSAAAAAAPRSPEASSARPSVRG